MLPLPPAVFAAAVDDDAAEPERPVSSASGSIPEGLVVTDVSVRESSVAIMRGTIRRSCSLESRSWSCCIDVETDVGSK